MFSPIVAALIRLVASVDGDAVRLSLDGRVPARVSRGIMTGLVALIMIRQTTMIVGAITSGATVGAMELAQRDDAFLVGSPALVVVGFQLWRHRVVSAVWGALDCAAVQDVGYLAHRRGWHHRSLGDGGAVAVPVALFVDAKSSSNAVAFNNTGAKPSETVRPPTPVHRETAASVPRSSPDWRSAGVVAKEGEAGHGHGERDTSRL